MVDLNQTWTVYSFIDSLTKIYAKSYMYSQERNKENESICLPKKRLYAVSFRSTNGLPKKSWMIFTHITAIHLILSIQSFPTERARAHASFSLPEPLTRNMYITSQLKKVQCTLYKVPLKRQKQKNFSFPYEKMARLKAKLFTPHHRCQRGEEFPWGCWATQCVSDGGGPLAPWAPSWSSSSSFWPWIWVHRYPRRQS